MPKVCILSSVHPALDNRVFYREAQSLHKNGYDVSLIAVYDKAEVRDGVSIIGLPQVPRWQRPRLWFGILKLALLTKADIYHFHDPELLLITPLLRILTGKPIIYDVHEVYPDFIKVKDYMPVWVRYPLAWIFRLLEPLLARLQSGLIFSDDAIAETFKNVHLPKATLFNYPGLIFIQDGIKATHDIDSRPLVVLHLGGHERNRGTRLMIESFHQILHTIPDARLFLVGHFMPPALQDEVQDDIDQRGIGQAVTITGRVPFNMIGKYLQQASVGWVPWQAYPKNDKNVPTKLFEYMAYRVPVVSSDLNSTRPYIQNGYNGYLVTPDNPKAHAEAIINILQNPVIGAVMGKNGQDLVNTLYNWNREEEKLLHLYNQLLT